jgi:SWIB/MDM2 domain
LGPDDEPIKKSSGPKHTFLPALASLTGVQADHRPQVQADIYIYTVLLLCTTASTNICEQPISPYSVGCCDNHIRLLCTAIHVERRYAQWSGCGTVLDTRWFSNAANTCTCCFAQALKLVWKYIKEHDLQDPRNKTEILCDDKMAAITGGERRYQ